jgi:hypothetical protein
MTDPSEQTTQLLAEIGRLVITWNGIERELSDLLEILAGLNDEVRAITAHMGSVSICNALQTIANEFLPDDGRDHVLHAVAVFETLREYRNYYVHGIIGLPPEQEIEPVVYTYGVSARGHLILHQGSITKTEIMDCVARAGELLRYVEALCWPAQTLAYHLRTVPSDWTSLPEKPPQPDRLV